MLYNQHVVIFGSNGMLGNTIKMYFKSMNKYEVIALTRKHFDILNTNIEELINLFKVFPNNSIIINATGLIPHSGNTNEDDYIKVNTQFPKLLDQLCTEYNHTFIHITTDCVFNGINNKGSYLEDSIKNETGMYGRSKALGEELTNATIIRTSIIGEQREADTNEQREAVNEKVIDKKMSLLQWVISKEDKTINGYNNHYWNGVTCLRLSQILHKMVEKRLYWKGVSHIFSNTVSKYDLLQYINKIYNLNITVNSIKCDQEINKTLASRHITNNIINQYVDKVEIYQQIKEQMIFFKKWHTI
jgi:dTDP-4-dehydrorhamnose reductase